MNRRDGPRCGRCGDGEVAHPNPFCDEFSLVTVDLTDAEHEALFAVNRGISGYTDVDCLTECLYDPDEPITQHERRQLFAIVTRVVAERNARDKEQPASSLDSNHPNLPKLKT